MPCIKPSGMTTPLSAKKSWLKFNTSLSYCHVITSKNIVFYVLQ